jgi:hypothetical protein
MNLYGCISTKPVYNFGYWPSVFYLTQPGGVVQSIFVRFAG